MKATVLCKGQASVNRLQKCRSRKATVCQCNQSVDRRQIGSALMGASLLFSAAAAQARDLDAAKKAKEARRAQLKAAAEDMEKTGRAESAFEDSSYAVSEDKTPNIHSRQEEGSKTQVNA
eukprot:TRINITY_DN397_c0_g1_i1.p3 TRINITY_DN397_c0_g1~~TRINITY_DN397_c0_g1_i1.p3  ORF type:complete len:120 (-),score=22.21 TRINITY_DN397_c0_g1_i1:284-643(-)